MTTTPEALRDAGMAQAEAATDSRWIPWIDAVIETANQSGKDWSVNDIRPQFPTSAGPLIGARVRAAATRRPREMTRVGYVASDLPSTHAHPVALWRGVTP